ncbi:MAG: hypothetical protein QXP98_00510 [Thermoproteus sp.]
MQNIGVKRTAGAVVGGCPHFVPNEEFERMLGERAHLHDYVKNEIRRELEGQGFKCEEEYPVEYVLPEDGKALGKADLYCIGNGIGIVIEIKSSFISNGMPRDVVQLYLYQHLLRRAGVKADYALLVYRNFEEVSSRTDIELDGNVILRLPSKYVYARLRVGDELEQSLNPEGVARELATDGYVIGRDCEKCVNTLCPLVRLRLRGT